MRNRIDAYSHVFTREVEEAFLDLDPSHGKHKPNLLYHENVDERIDHLDRIGVDKQVITMTGQRIWPNVDPADGIEATRLANDEVRRYADTDPDRFVPVGTVPFLTGEYIDEFERCVNDLDLAGIQIFTNANGKPLDHDDFDAFYAAVDDADVPIWIHPLDSEWYPDLDADDYWLYAMMGWPFDTGLAIGRLVFSGVLDRFENLEIVTHHLGGVLPYLEERMRSWVETRQEYGDAYTGAESIQALSEPIDAYFDRVYADTAVSSRGLTHTLASGLEFFGEDNILFGADVPYGPGGGTKWLETTIPTIEEWDVPERTKRKIFSENVESLLAPQRL
jgi:aminocarboxymuconate-semialdehyde decarboxylase